MSATPMTDVEELARTLRRRFRTRETTLDLAGRTLGILHPADPEDLIDEQEFERDERLPYWADLWPSARILAQVVLGLDGAGRTLLELGCGSGLVSACAAMAGFAVTASDYYDDALAFTRVNVWTNAGIEPETMPLDWRALPPSLPRFDCVVASDVLYERPYGALVAHAIARTLAEGGEAIVTDPGRVAAAEFTREAGLAGLRVAEPERRVFTEGSIRQTISVYRLTRTGMILRGQTP